MRRFWVIAAIGCGGLVLLLFLFVACAALLGSNSNRDNNTAQGGKTDTSQASSGTKSKEDTKPLRLSGRGSDTLTFTYNRAALITYKYSYTAEKSTPGYFALHLLDEQGKELDLVASHVGTTLGSKAVRIPKAGTYTMNVNADNGSWTVESIG